MRLLPPLLALLIASAAVDALAVATAKGISRWRTAAIAGSAAAGTGGFALSKATTPKPKTEGTYRFKCVLGSGGSTACIPEGDTDIQRSCVTGGFNCDKHSDGSCTKTVGLEGEYAHNDATNALWAMESLRACCVRNQGTPCHSYGEAKYLEMREPYVRQGQ